MLRFGSHQHLCVQGEINLQRAIVLCIKLAQRVHALEVTESEDPEDNMSDESIGADEMERGSELIGGIIMRKWSCVEHTVMRALRHHGAATEGRRYPCADQ